MQGCSDENQAVAYFDKIYIPLHQIVSLDDSLHTNLEALLILEEQMDSNLSMEENDFSALQNSLDILADFVDSQIIELKELQVYKNENNIKQVYSELLSTYKYELTNNYPKMIAIMKNKDEVEADIIIFNELLNNSQIKLNKVLEDFYSVAEIYAETYDIGIEEE